MSLKQRNLAELTRTALAVSDPRSPTYKDYLTNQELQALTAPPAAAVSRVLSWLGETAALAGDGATVTASPTVREAKALFSTDSISTIYNHLTGEFKLRAGRFSVHPAVAGDVETVFGLHGLPLPLEIISVQAPPGKGPPAVTPAVLTKYYDIPAVDAAGESIPALLSIALRCSLLTHPRRCPLPRHGPAGGCRVPGADDERDRPRGFLRQVRPGRCRRGRHGLRVPRRAEEGRQRNRGR